MDTSSVEGCFCAPDLRSPEGRTLGVWSADGGGNITYADESMLRLLERSREETEGAAFERVLAPGSPTGWDDLCALGREDDGALREVWFARSSGAIIRVNVSASVWRDEDGAVRWVLGQAHRPDPETRNDEGAGGLFPGQSLRPAQQSILDTIPDIAWLKDCDGRFIAVNAAFAQTCGVAADELVGATDFAVWDLDLARLYYAGDMEVLRTGESKTTEELIVDREGEFRWVETVRSPMVDEMGAIVGVAGIARDITTRKQKLDQLHYSRQELEKRVRERTAELEQTNRTLVQEIEERKQVEGRLKRAKEKADTATRSKSYFLANMSHEVRTPLNAILGMTEMAMRSEPSPEVRHYLSTVRNAGSSLLTIINDILDVSKIEARKLTLESVDFDLREVLENAMQLYGLEPRKRGLAVSWSMDKETPRYLKGDPVRLRQVLGNLLGNAAKFTSEGAITMTVRPLTQCVGGDDTTVRLLFSVADTGVGIPLGKQHGIFSPFTQADDSVTRRFGGAGLGLTICKYLVGLMGGQIGVESEEGKGATFSFTAVFSPGDPDRARRLESVTARPNHGGARKKSDRLLRVLLAEDNALNRDLVVMFLGNEGHSVDTVDNGAKAVERLAAEHYDLVLMDIQMPEMDGLTATRLIRSGNTDALDRKVPIIAMTAHALKGDREKFLRAGMSGYVAKPVDLDLLTETIDAVVNERTPEGAAEESPSAPAGVGSEPKALQCEDAAPAAPAAAVDDGGGLQDRAKALSLLRGNEKLLAHLEMIFLRDAPGELEQLAAAMEQGDLATAKALAHNIKSTSATVGALACSEAARELDAACKAGDAAKARELHDRLARVAGETAAHLRRVAGEDG